MNPWVVCKLTLICDVCCGVKGNKDKPYHKPFNRVTHHLGQC